MSVGLRRNFTSARKFGICSICYIDKEQWIFITNTFMYLSDCCQWARYQGRLLKELAWAQLWAPWKPNVSLAFKSWFWLLCPCSRKISWTIYFLFWMSWAGTLYWVHCDLLIPGGENAYFVRSESNDFPEVVGASGLFEFDLVFVMQTQDVCGQCVPKRAPVGSSDSNRARKTVHIYQGTRNWE